MENKEWGCTIYKEGSGCVKDYCMLCVCVGGGGGGAGVQGMLHAAPLFEDHNIKALVQHPQYITWYNIYSFISKGSSYPPGVRHLLECR